MWLLTTLVHASAAFRSYDIRILAHRLTPRLHVRRGGIGHSALTPLATCSSNLDTTPRAPLHAKLHVLFAATPPTAPHPALGSHQRHVTASFASNISCCLRSTPVGFLPLTTPLTTATTLACSRRPLRSTPRPTTTSCPSLSRRSRTRSRSRSRRSCPETRIRSLSCCRQNRLPNR